MYSNSMNASLCVPQKIDEVEHILFPCEHILLSHFSGDLHTQPSSPSKIYQIYSFHKEENMDCFSEQTNHTNVFDLVP